jgi:hypothetical protein
VATGATGRASRHAGDIANGFSGDPDDVFQFRPPSGVAVHVAVPSTTQRVPSVTKRALVIVSVSATGRSVILVLLQLVAVHAAGSTPGLRDGEAQYDVLGGLGHGEGQLRLVGGRRDRPQRR